MRWTTVSDSDDALFDIEDLVGPERGTGRMSDLEFLHVTARKILNHVPSMSRLNFAWTINVYRGCSHACAYCLAGDTPILMADGRTKPIADVRIGDRVYGTARVGNYLRYTATEVLDHWQTTKRAYRVTLSDGTALLASGDHRFLTERGWKFVADASIGQRPHLTTNNSVLGIGKLAEPPKEVEDYKRGYPTGMIRGDGHIGSYVCARPGRDGTVHRFRLALVDDEPLDRSARYLHEFGIETGRSNGDAEILDRVVYCSRRFGVQAVLERPATNGVMTVRIAGGLQERLRFVLLTDPATTRKRTMDGMAIKFDADLRVSSIEDTGLLVPMYDITTGTGDFIASGVISHNCFARPTHEYLGLNIGDDFNTKIVVKINAVERLRAELADPRWTGERIAMGTNTDPYQRAEGKYKLTRGVLEVLTEHRNPFSILTKSALVTRDLDILRDAAQCTDVSVNFSIATLDERVWRATEPGTPHPRRRLDAMRQMTEAGIATGALMAPILPGLSDAPDQLAEVADAIRATGGRVLGVLPLHLRPGVREHFLGWLAGFDPELHADYLRRYGDRAYAPKRYAERLQAAIRPRS